MKALAQGGRCSACTSRPSAAAAASGAALLRRLIDDARAQPELDQLDPHRYGHERRCAHALYERAGFRSFGVEPRAIRVGDTYHDKNHMILFLDAAMTISRFSFPTTIHFGAGARKLVPRISRKHGVRRPLVVTDRGIAPLPLLAAFVADLAGLDVAVFSEIWGNPVRSQVTAAPQRAGRTAPTPSSASAAARRSTSPRRSR